MLFNYRLGGKRQEYDVVQLKTGREETGRGCCLAIDWKGRDRKVMLFNYRLKEKRQEGDVVQL